MGRYIIQADYTRLDRAAREFTQWGDSLSDLARQARACTEALLDGGWTGAGANAFFGEMHALIFPALNRLVNTLNQSGNQTQHIALLLREAEAEAGRLFHGGSESAAMKFPPEMTRPFTSEGAIQSAILRRLPDVIAYLGKTDSGRDLLQQMSDAKLQFLLPAGVTFPDNHGLVYVEERDGRNFLFLGLRHPVSKGDFVVGYTGSDGGIQIIPISLDELSGATGEYDHHITFGGQLTLSTSRWTYPLTGMDLANTLAHEMQHALDYKLGITKIVDVNMANPDIHALEADLTESVKYRVLTEVRAHARGQSVVDETDFTLNDITRFDQLSPEQIKDILEDRGYKQDYISTMNRQFDVIYQKHPELGLRRAEIAIDTDGTIQVKITEAISRQDILITHIEDWFSWLMN